MSDCTIPAGVNARIIDEPSCLIESDGKKYIQFSLEYDPVSEGVLVSEQPEANDGSTKMALKEKITATYIGGDVNGDGFADRAIVTTMVNSQRGTIPNTVETKVYFGQEPDKEPKDGYSDDQFHGSTTIFKGLNQGRRGDLPFSNWNLSSLQMYKPTYPIKDNPKILWVSVPEDPKPPK